MFWLLSDSIKANTRTKDDKRAEPGDKISNVSCFENDPESSSEVYLEELYRQWEVWFENYVRERARIENQMIGKHLPGEKHLSGEKQSPKIKVTT